MKSFSLISCSSELQCTWILCLFSAFLFLLHSLLLSSISLFLFPLHITLSEGQQWLPWVGRVAHPGGLQRTLSLQLRKQGAGPGVVWGGRPSPVEISLTGAANPGTLHRYQNMMVVQILYSSCISVVSLVSTVIQSEWIWVAGPEITKFLP